VWFQNRRSKYRKQEQKQNIPQGYPNGFDWAYNNIATFMAPNTGNIHAAANIDKYMMALSNAISTAAATKPQNQ
jgi:hypothetical protein